MKTILFCILTSTALAACGGASDSESSVAEDTVNSSVKTVNSSVKSVNHCAQCNDVAAPSVNQPSDNGGGGTGRPGLPGDSLPDAGGSSRGTPGSGPILTGPSAL